MSSKWYRVAIASASGAIFLVSALWWGEVAPPLALMALGFAGMAVSVVLRTLEGNGRHGGSEERSRGGPSPPGHTPPDGKGAAAPPDGKGVGQDRS